MLNACGRKMSEPGPATSYLSPASKAHTEKVYYPKPKKVEIFRYGAKASAMPKDSIRTDMSRDVAVRMLSSDSLKPERFKGDAVYKIQQAKELIEKAESLEKTYKRRKYTGLFWGSFGQFILLNYVLLNMGVWIPVLHLFSFLLFLIGAIISLNRLMRSGDNERRKAVRLIRNAAGQPWKKDYTHNKLESLHVLRYILSENELKSALREIRKKVMKSGNQTDIDKLNFLTEWTNQRFKDKKKGAREKRNKVIGRLLLFLGLIAMLLMLVGFYDG